MSLSGFRESKGRCPEPVAAIETGFLGYDYRKKANQELKRSG